MSAIEIIICAVAMVSMIFSGITLCLTYSWKFRVERRCYAVDHDNVQTRQCVNDLDTELFHIKEDLIELKGRFADAGVETLKVRSDDHDKAIDSIRKDLLDIQVLSGTLPSRAGTLLQEVDNALAEMKSLQSAYKEQQALLQTTKEQMEKLAAAYASLHFTGKEIEEMRDGIEELKRRIA